MLVCIDEARGGRRVCSHVVLLVSRWEVEREALLDYGLCEGAERADEARGDARVRRTHLVFSWIGGGDRGGVFLGFLLQPAQRPSVAKRQFVGQTALELGSSEI